MRFEAGKFYAQDTSGYEITDNRIILFYCRKIFHEGRLEMAQLIAIDGTTLTTEVEMSQSFKEITKSEFAEKLLERTIEGHAYLSSTIHELKWAEIKRKDEEARKELENDPDYISLMAQIFGENSK